MFKSWLDDAPPEVVGFVLGLPIAIVVFSFYERPKAPPPKPYAPPSKLEKVSEVVGNKAAEAGRGFTRGVFRKLWE